MSTFNPEQAIDSFWRHRQQGVHYPPEWYDALTLDQAYLVQLGMLDRLLVEGAQQAGWKVGLTSQAIRDQYRVHEPVFGYVLSSGVHADGVTLAFDQLIRPAFENEVCMTLGSGLAGPEAGEAQALAAVASLRPALEIVENRGPFTEQLAVALADDVQQKGVVLGPETRPVPPDLDLTAIGVEVSINGVRAAEGVSAAVMGSPLHSLIWLANKLAQYGRRLESGQLVMTGSLTQQFPASQGDVVSASFSLLGSVTASFP